jgi:hypothetical protein
VEKQFTGFSERSAEMIDMTKENLIYVGIWLSVAIDAAIGFWAGREWQKVFGGRK